MDFESRIHELRENGMNDGDNKEQFFRMYVLVPYVSTGLSYDVYDLRTSGMLDSGSTFKFQPEVLEGLSIYFSLLPDYTRFNEETDRAYVYIDLEGQMLSMYFKVFNEWHLVNVVHFFAESDDDRKLQADILTAINETLHLSAFNDNYPNLGERYFTSVVLDNKVASGEVLNIFVRKALVQELRQPTDALVRLLASVLQEYTTQPEEWVIDALEPIKDKGVVSLIEEAVSKDELKLKHVSRPTPTPLLRKPKPADVFRAPKKQVVEEKVENFIEDKMDVLSSLGFADASEKDKAKEDEKQVNKPLAGDKEEVSPTELDNLKADDGTVDLMKL